MTAISALPARAGRFEALDSLCGVCAYIVVLYHLRIEYPVLRSDFIGGGYLFVDFFFVLSGFVIARNYAGRIRDGTGPGVFLIRRFFRLLPLHLFILSVYLLYELLRMVRLGVAFGAESGRTGVDLLRTLLLTNSFAMEQQTLWNRPSWSISAEWWTYVVFGLLVLALGGGARLRAGLAMLAASGIAVLALTSDYMGQAVADFGLFRCFYSFGLGALLSAFWPQIAVQLERLRDWQVAAAEILLLVAVFVFVGSFRHSLLSLATPLLFLATLTIFTQERGLVSQLLGRRFFLRAGLLSYSIYMVQQLVIGRAGEISLLVGHLSGIATVPALLPILLSVVGVWVVASFTYRFVELPGQLLGVRMVALWRQRKESV